MNAEITTQEAATLPKTKTDIQGVTIGTDVLKGIESRYRNLRSIMKTELIVVDIPNRHIRELIDDVLGDVRVLLDEREVEG